MVARTRSRRRLGAVLSSRGNEHLNCPEGVTDEEGIKGSARVGMVSVEDEEGVGNRGNDDPGTLGGTTDLDRKASIASKSTSSATEAARGSGRPVLRGGN